MLASTLPILGVVKTKEEAEQLRELLGPGERFRAFSDRLHDILCKDPDTELVMITEDAEKEAGEAVAAWVAEYATLPGL